MNNSKDSKNVNKKEYCDEVQVKHIGETEIKLIQNAYKKDFEIFGYDMNNVDIPYNH